MTFHELKGKEPQVLLAQISPFSPQEEKEKATCLADDKIQSLEDTILECQRKIFDWKSFQNNLTSISRLPDEILAQIFLDIVKSGYVAFNSAKWISVTHVCRRWRQAALNCSELWTYPSYHKAECASAMIERAKALPLKLFILNTRQTDDCTITWGYNPWNFLPGVSADREGAFRNLHRAEELILHDDIADAYGERYWWENSEWRAPLLRRLTVSSPYPQRDQLPLGKLLVESPILEELVLKNWTLGVSDSPYLSSSSLTRLELAVDITQLGNPYQQQQQRSIPELILILKNLPNLEYLKMWHIIALLSDEDQTWCSTLNVCADLPQLRTLNIINGTADTCRHLVDHITYPPAATAMVSVSSSIRDLDDEEAIQERVQSEVNDAVALLRNMSERFKDNIAGLDLRVWDGPLPQYPSPIEPGQVRSQFALHLWPYSPQGIVTLQVPLRSGILIASKLPGLLPLQDLADLYCDLAFSDDAFWEAYSRLPKIQLLDIINTSPALLSVLSCAVPLGDGGGGIHIHTSADPSLQSHNNPFPALKTFVLRDWEFDTNSPDAETSFGFPRGVPAELGRLLRFFACRSKRPETRVAIVWYDCVGISQEAIDEADQAPNVVSEAGSSDGDH